MPVTSSTRKIKNFSSYPDLTSPENPRKMLKIYNVFCYSKDVSGAAHIEGFYSEVVATHVATYSLILVFFHTSY